MEPGKLAISGCLRPVRARARATGPWSRGARRRGAWLLGAGWLLAALTGCGPGEPDRGGDAAAAGDGAAVPEAPPLPHETEVIVDTVGQGGFRPVAFQSADTLWGVLRGRLTRLDPATGRVHAGEQTAWSLDAAPGVVGWRNETGTWGERVGDRPRRLAPTELMPGYEGPPVVLWSPDGRRAILTWTAEWDAHHELLEENGERRTLASLVEGYMLDLPVLWLDDGRVLFTIVANAPRGGEPAYRESGWRGDLAVLDLEGDRFDRVTDTPDTTWLRPAGLLEDGLLVREHDPSGTTAHWLYDTSDWSRRSIDLPRGLSFAAGDAIVTYAPPAGESGPWRATLHAGGRTRALGALPEPMEPPAFTRDGRRIALRVLHDGRSTVLLVRR